MPTVLLVDDSATDRRMIGGILERNGLSVRYAENGAGALKQIQKSPPDAVLTDMQMPEMDGLELVKAVRASYPEVPVILMTGHGSETLAAQALQHGAASYVPKSQANKWLVDSVKHVLELARGDASYRKLIERTVLTDFHFELENDPELIEPLVALVQQMIAGMGICDPAGRLQAGVALEQAILNAMYHGNLELTSDQLRESEQKAAEGVPSLLHQRLAAAPFKDRKVLVRALVTRDEARFVVRDQGPGFDVQNNLNIQLGDDDQAGRGLVLMWGLMDKVIYNKKGNEVTLIKRRAAASPPEAEKVATTESGILEQAKKAKRPVGTTLTEEPEVWGELVPLDGGSPIPLTKRRLSIGRDASCDIVLSYSDVSAHHCLLYNYCGWWYVKDLKSVNGVRINKKLVDQKRIAPGATLAVATHQYEFRYSPWDLGAEGITPPVDPF